MYAYLYVAVKTKINTNLTSTLHPKLEKRLGGHKSKVGSSKLAIREHVEQTVEHKIEWENVSMLERVQKIFKEKLRKPSISGL